MGVIPASGPVLHPTDFTEGARAAYPYSLYLAGLFETELRVLHVEEPEGESAPSADFPDSEAAEEASAWIAASRRAGEETSGAVEGAPRRVRRVSRRASNAAEGILSYAEEVGAGAICMGTHGRTGLRRLVLGSIAEQVIREVRCPVLTVRRGIPRWDEVGPRRLLVAADLSPMMRPALAWAGLLAAATGADLEAVHVVTSTAAAAGSGKRRRIHSVFNELGVADVDLDARLAAGGNPADRLRRLAEEEGVDMIVSATHGRSGPARLVLGSVAEDLVRRALCPVLTVSEPPGLR